MFLKVDQTSRSKLLSNTVLYDVIGLVTRSGNVKYDSPISYENNMILYMHCNICTSQCEPISLIRETSANNSVRKSTRTVENSTNSSFIHI